MEIRLDSAENIKVQDPVDIYDIIQKIFYQKKGEVDLMKEHFWVFSLNKALNILAIELVGIGCKDRVIADPGDVFRVPLYKSSSYIVLVHNHPSGSVKPSEGDMDITNRLIKAGEILDVKVMEHVIVTDRSYYSFRDNGLIQKLELDSSYAVSFMYEKKMTRKIEALEKALEKEKKQRKLAGLKRGAQKGKEKGAKKAKREIARNLLLQGVDIKIVEASTGLTKQWVGRIKNEIENN